MVSARALTVRSRLAKQKALDARAAAEQEFLVLRKVWRRKPSLLPLGQ